MASEDFLTYLQNLDERGWNARVNKDWTVKDVVAHLAGWEREAANILPLAWQTRETPWFMETENYDEFNAMNVAEFKDYTTDQLLEEWRRWQKKVDEEIDKIGEEKLKAAKGFEWVFDEGGESHYREHFEQIQKVVGK